MYNKRKIIYNDKNVITNLKQVSPISDSYRRIKVNIDNINKDNHKVFMVTSALNNEGKTLSLINLAACYAEDKSKKVLVVDLDLRNPSLHNYFETNNEFGLVDYVLDNKINIVKNEKLHLDFIPAGKETTLQTSLLENKKVKELFIDLRNKYDYIFVDSPSIKDYPDALVIANYCDSTLFVISQVVSNKKDTILALKELEKNNIKVLGNIYNDVK